MADYQSSHSGPTIDNRVTQVATNTADIAALKSRVDGAEAKIPSSATSSNKLADKAYVDSTASGLNSTISGLNSTISDLNTRLGSVESGLGNKVDKVSGKGLSTNDYTDSEKTKLAGINNGAQANVLEAVKVGGTALTITNKAVNIELVTTADIDALF